MRLQEIADKLGFDLEDVEMLMDMFISDSISSIEDIQTHIIEDDKQELKNIAHGIKGSAANLMLCDIASMAKEIEQFASSDSDIDYEELFTKLRDKIILLETEKEKV